MCSKKNCERHEFDYGLCLIHLKEALGIEDVTTKKKRKGRKQIDAVEVMTTDVPVEEVRED